MSDENAILNESFADFFAYQVAGGTNYFATDNSQPNLAIDYCISHSTGPSPLCLESNYQDALASDGRDRIRAASSIYFDVFDGPRAANSRNLGEYWVTNGVRPIAATWTNARADDERVVTSPRQMLNWISNWRRRGMSLTFTNLFRGLDDTMVNAGYNWCDRCRLFANHAGQSTANLRQMWAACTQAPISTYLDEPPPDPSLNFTESCRVCPAGTSPWGNDCVGNVPPSVVIDAPARYHSVMNNDPLRLSATGTDPEGQPLTYQWSYIDAGGQEHPIGAGASVDWIYPYPIDCDHEGVVPMQLKVVVTDSQGANSTAVIPIYVGIIC